MPTPYKLKILLSRVAFKTVWRFLTISGSKVPFLSRGVSSSKVRAHALKFK